MKFNPNSPFFRFMDTLARFAFLNWCFILSCLPIITIGAALSGMHATLLKYISVESTPLVKSYWHAFKQNFKQATITWLILLAGFSILGFNIAFWHKFQGMIGLPILVIVIIATAVLVLVMELVLPLIGVFTNSIKQAFKNALLMIITNFVPTMLLVWIDGCAYVIFYLTNIGRVMFLIFGFAFWLYIKAFVHRKLFSKYTSEL